MADKTFTKTNQDFYYVQQKTGSEAAIGDYESACIRLNSVGTTSWVRTVGFTTGNYRVTSLKIHLIDCNTTTSYVSSGKGYFGISATKYSSGTASIPAFTWKSSAVTYQYYNSSYNSYYATVSVDLRPFTTYYIYIYCSSGSAWDCITQPTSTSSSRVTKMELTFVEKELWGLVKIYTSSGWVNAVPYVYSNGWQQCLPYVYNSGWTMASG